ncbi:hypothetical protein K435DRAFT_800234 [Dendrothele bispora CBS 962.96]|uniref:Uncharacterized protein n=1 Tax=Dendrothele bispora (strain CBS 962.96) TaxID=1314807 RepID=A0A4S8LT72_DENBC|nr:hypothetical protein K435DRAFT_800234 [Dendrothele bispora CBS 962.96]
MRVLSTATSSRLLRGKAIPVTARVGASSRCRTWSQLPPGNHRALSTTPSRGSNVLTEAWERHVLPRVRLMAAKTAKQLVDELFKMQPFLSRDWSFIYNSWYSGPVPSPAATESDGVIGEGWTCDWKKMPQDLVWRLMPMSREDGKSFLEIVMEEYIGVAGKPYPIAYYRYAEGKGARWGNLVLFRDGSWYFMLKEEETGMDSVFQFSERYPSDESFVLEMDLDKCSERLGGPRELEGMLYRLYQSIQGMRRDVTELR